MRPRFTREIKDQVDLVAASAIPLLVRNVFKPVEVRHRGEVEQHVDPAVRAQREVDKRLTVGRLVEPTRLHGDHLSAPIANHLDGGLRRFDGHIATDDRRTLSSERHGSRPAHAPARARGDAHLSFKPA